MVTKCDFVDGGCRVVIRPNCSMTPFQMVLFYLAVFTVSMMIALRFYLLGAWVVLPITLLEMLVLGAALYCFQKKTRLREVIELSEKKLSVCRQSTGHSQSWQFQPYWVRMRLLKDATGWYPSRLVLQSHGRRVEIGGCLTEDERTRLYCDLEQQLKTCS